MCGITGIYNLKGRAVDTLLLKDMTEALAHRGPDDYGYMIAHTASSTCSALRDDMAARQGAGKTDLGLGHRRLSIIDLSEAAHQPMSDPSGKAWIVYNGEIYNYIELREELKSRGRRFRTGSDTEVVLNAYLEWGHGCLRRFNGMFAFAIWDSVKSRLFCARDRFGIKPFYYALNRERFAFASEIKALLSESSIERKADKAKIYDYLAYNLLDHSEESFFKGIKQLMPAHCLIVQGSKVSIERWWDINPHAGGEPRRDDSYYSQEFYRLFEDSVRLRLRSDVPVGSCLSGGLDSSAIVCMINRLLGGGKGGTHKAAIGRHQKTFSACFEEPRYDERPYMAAVTEQTNAEANYVFPDGAKLFDTLPALVWHQEEPFRTTSIYAQWNVMRLAREKGLKVLLDGQGADELMAGYHLFFTGRYRDVLASLNPMKLIKEAISYRESHGAYPVAHVANALRGLLPESLVAVLKSALKADPAWIDGGFKKEYSRGVGLAEKFPSKLDDQLYAYLTRYNLPSLLHYEDRNSMAFSIEARVPFLDYRLVEYLFTLPPGLKIRGGETKVVLREAVQGLIPQVVLDRRDKIGFETPEDEWFRTVLKDNIEDIIYSKRFGELPFFDHARVKRELKAHMQGSKNIGSTIWKWLNLYMWLERFDCSI